MSSTESTPSELETRNMSPLPGKGKEFICAYCGHKGMPPEIINGWVYIAELPYNSRWTTICSDIVACVERIKRQALEDQAEQYRKESASGND